MKQINGVFLPDTEAHLPAFLEQRDTMRNGRGSYQIAKLEAAMQFVPAHRRRAAIDVGAHCGLWSMQLVGLFEQVHAFEPMAVHRECWRANVTTGTAHLYPFALGDRAGSCRMMWNPDSTGDTFPDPASLGAGADVAGGDTPIRTLDDVADESGITDLDFVKLDCEGFELKALQGGRNTLLYWLPAVIVEQKPGRAQKFGLGETDAVTWLEAFGYRLRKVISGDYILTHPEGR